MNSNPFYKTTDYADAGKTCTKTIQLKSFIEYDLETQAGQIYTFQGK